jgi:hypothetical protein
MTRVTKGPNAKAGKPSLVCVAAKGGKRDAEGNKACQYRAVPLEPIEDALREDIWTAIEQAPTPGQDKALDGLIEGQEAAIGNIAEQIEKIVEAIAAGGGSPALTGKLRGLEKDHDEAKAELSRFQDRRAAAHGPFLLRRLTALREAFEAEPFDRGAANTRLREACVAVVVDPEEMTLVFEWKHGGASGIAYGWPGVTDRRSSRAGTAP